MFFFQRLISPIPFLVLGLFLWSQGALAQTPNILDSLQRAVNSASSDTARIRALCYQSDALVIYGQKDSLARMKANEALSLAERLRFNQDSAVIAYFRALALRTLGTTYRFAAKELRPTADTIFPKALEEAKRIPQREHSLLMQASVRYAWFTGLRFRIDTHFQGDKPLEALRNDVKNILDIQQIIADNLNSNALRGQVLLCRAFILTKDIAQKVLLTTEAVRLYEQSPDAEGLVYVLTFEGYFAELISDNARAMKAYRRAAQVGLERNFFRTVAISYFAIGDIYAKIADTVKALEYYQRAEPYTERYDVKFNHIELLQRMGLTYQCRNEPDKAQHYFEKALALNQTMGPNLYNVIRSGQLYRQLGRNQASLKELQDGRRIAERSSAKKPIADFLYEISLTYKQQAEGLKKQIGAGRLYQPVLDSALFCAKRHLRILQEGTPSQPNPDQLLSAYSLLFELSKEHGNTEEALGFLEQLRYWEKITLGAEKSLEIAAMDSRAAVEAVEAKVETLQAQDRLQRAIGIAIGIAAIALAIILGLLIRRNNERKKTAILLEERNNQLSQKNEQLQSLSQEKTTMMGIVAHDLKNPIAAVRSLASLIESDMLEDRDEILKIARHIVRAANQMLDLVINLLDNNRLEEGAMRFYLVPLNLAPTLESLVWRYQKPASAKNITVHYSSEAPSHLVLVDETAIVQVFDNILSNAVKYSPHGKNVFVRIRHSSLVVGHSPNDSRTAPMTNAPMTNNFIRVEVQDEGEGISPDDMTKLFGKFARLSARPTGGEHSTGLGLSIVKKMVEAMNGRVWCESELGKGATFIVELPKST
jgi:signal transduction histidine kinase